MCVYIVSSLILTCFVSVVTNLTGAGVAAAADFAGANFTPYVLTVNAGEVCVFVFNSHIVFRHWSSHAWMCAGCDDEDNDILSARFSCYMHPLS